MTVTKLFRSFPDTATQITDSQAKGTPHFRVTYDNDRVVFVENVDDSGTAIEMTVLRYVPGFVQEGHYDRKGHRIGVNFEHAEKKPSGHSKVSFNSRGEVVEPIETTHARDSLEVLARICLTPQFDVMRDLTPFAGQPVELYLPRKADFHRLDHPHVYGRMAALGITPRVAHTYSLDVTDKALVAQLALIRGNYGVPVMTVHPTKAPYALAAHSLMQIGEGLGNIGVRLAVENLDSHGTWLSSPEQISEINLPYVSLTLDISHLPLGTDLAALAETLFEKIAVVHLSNRAGAQKHLPYRQGELAAGEFLQVLKANGYQGKIVLEYGPEFVAEKKADTQKIREFFE